MQQKIDFDFSAVANLQYGMMATRLASQKALSVFADFGLWFVIIPMKIG